MVNVANFVNEIEVIDPDTNDVVHLAVYKHQNGGMFAVDSSFIEQVAEECSAGDAVINDPFADVLPGMDLVLTEE